MLTLWVSREASSEAEMSLQDVSVSVSGSALLGQGKKRRAGPAGLPSSLDEAMPSSRVRTLCQLAPAWGMGAGPLYPPHQAVIGYISWAAGV